MTLMTAEPGARQATLRSGMNFEEMPLLVPGPGGGHMLAHAATSSKVKFTGLTHNLQVDPEV
jgi:hypothetical protein